MAEKLFMIALSPTMTEGTLTRWKVKEGEAFKSGSLLCEVETDKATMDYEAPKDGSLLKILLAEGGKAAVGDVIAVIGKAGEKPDALLAELGAAAAAPEAVPAAAPKAAPPPKAAVPDEAPAAPAPKTAVSQTAEAAPSSGQSEAEVTSAPGGRETASSSGAPPSSPLARVLALELGVDIRSLKGSGPGGRVIQRDVKAAAGAPAAAARPAEAGFAPARTSEQEVRVEAVAGKRAVIARRLSESFFTAPHYYLKRTVNAERLLALREDLAASDGRKPSVNAILAKLAAAALSLHPAVNAGWKADGSGGAVIEYRSRADIGLAVALEDGLITPVVRGCGAKGIAEIDREMTALIEKARGSGLTQEEYTGATFTISNLGGLGVEEFTAIINPPGSAILAVGAALAEPVALPDGSVAVRKRMRLTLGCDHRVIDGAVGAAFLRDLANMVEEPARALR